MAKKSPKDIKDVDGLIDYLKSIGYPETKKKTNNKVIILTNENRIDVLEDVAKKSGGKYDNTPSGESSVGKVKIGNFAVLVKPASKQGGASAGLENEKMLVDVINKACKTGPINVVFQESSSKKYKITGCVSAKSVGRDTSNRKKADVILKDSKGNSFPISIKKDNAEIWESADTYYNKGALKAVDKAVKAKQTRLRKHTGYYTIDPNIAVKATVAETKDVVFGSDIAAEDGAIITATYSKKSFQLVDDTLTIKVTDIITQMSDISTDQKVYFLIRNDKTRKSLPKYPGLRVLAVYKTRINKNVVVV